MSFLNELRSKKCSLKPTVTNITYSDGSQQQILISQDGDPINVSTSKTDVQRKTYGFIVDTKPDFKMACILDNFLYLGSQDSVNVENIQEFNITNILSIGIETPDADIIKKCNGNDAPVQLDFIECLDLPETKMEQIVKQTNAIITGTKSRNGKILVHCNAGVSRSTTICLAYLMMCEKMSFKSAYELIKAKRECIQPNCGFMRQLKEMDCGTAS